MVVDPWEYERYGWIISGPYLSDDVGGGPFRMMLYSGLFAAGLVLTCLALILRTFVRNTG